MEQTTSQTIQEEIKTLEDRLQTLPDNQVDERIEVRKKLIKLYIQIGKTITI